MISERSVSEIHTPFPFDREKRVFSFSIPEVRVGDAPETILLQVIEYVTQYEREGIINFCAGNGFRIQYQKKDVHDPKVVINGVIPFNRFYRGRSLESAEAGISFSDEFSSCQAVVVFLEFGKVYLHNYASDPFGPARLVESLQSQGRQIRMILLVSRDAAMGREVATNVRQQLHAEVPIECFQVVANGDEPFRFWASTMQDEFHWRVTDKNGISFFVQQS